MLPSVSPGVVSLRLNILFAHLLTQTFFVLNVDGDFIFQSARRSLTQNMNEACVKVYGYLFADQPPPYSRNHLGAVIAPGSLGGMYVLVIYSVDLSYGLVVRFSPVPHAAELPYVFNFLNKTVYPTSSLTLARIIQDYWISFATDLDPNDGRGFKRTSLTHIVPISGYPYVFLKVHIGPSTHLRTKAS